MPSAAPDLTAITCSRILMSDADTILPPTVRTVGLPGVEEGPGEPFARESQLCSNNANPIVRSGLRWRNEGCSTPRIDLELRSGGSPMPKRYIDGDPKLPGS